MKKKNKYQIILLYLFFFPFFSALSFDDSDIFHEKVFLSAVKKSKYEKVSEMLHAMHSAQQYVLKATHDPVERADINEFGYSNHIHTADKLGDEALRKFRETYEGIFKNEIVFYTDEKSGFLKFREQLSQSRGGKKTKNKL